MSSRRPTADRFIRNLRRQRTLLAALLVLGGALVLLHASASYSYRVSTSDGPLAQRTQAAQRARRLEPFNARFVARAELLGRWNRGAELLSAGDYNGSVAVLAEALPLGRDEAELIALYKRAQAVQALETNKKAHLQHGHEGPGGTLEPEDVER